MSNDYNTLNDALLLINTAWASTPNNTPACNKLYSIRRYILLRMEILAMLMS
jgi:hypothetical protein